MVDGSTDLTHTKFVADHQHQINQRPCHTLVRLALGNWRQGDQKFKPIFFREHGETKANQGYMRP